MSNPQYAREAQIVLWVQWIFFSLLGWALGLLLTTNADDGASALTLFGIRAATLGLAQFFVLRAYLGRMALGWLVATPAGFMLGQWLAQQLVGVLRTQGGLPNLNNLANALLLGGVLGVLLGLSLGLAQMWLLPADGGGRGIWLLLSVIGWGLGLQLSTLFVGAPSLVTSTFAVLLSSTATGFWLTQLIDRPPA